MGGCTIGRLQAVSKSMAGRAISKKVFPRGGCALDTPYHGEVQPLVCHQRFTPSQHLVKEKAAC
jgi:hypothetical protein